MDSDFSLNDPGNLATSFGTPGCRELDFSLLSSDKKLLLAAIEPDIVDRSAPFDTLGASSKFFPAFAHAAGLTSGPECDDLL